MNRYGSDNMDMPLDDEQPEEELDDSIESAFSVVRSSVDKIKLTVEELPINFISSGSTLLDLAMADQLPGGFPIGQMSQIFGDFSTGKSLLTIEAMCSAALHNAEYFLIESEGAFSTIRAMKVFGLEKIHEHIIPCSTIEHFFDDILPELRKQKTAQFMLIGVDSVTAMSSEVENTDLRKGEYARKPRQISRAMEQIDHNKLREEGIALVFVDQIRDTMATGMFAEKTQATSGRALRFYTRNRVKLAKTGTVVVTKKGVKKTVGVDIQAKVVKSTIAAPLRAVPIRILFDYGIDDITSNLIWLKELGINPNSMIGTSGKNIAAQRVFIEENDMEEDVRHLVHEAWKEFYAVDERKPKKRF